MWQKHVGGKEKLIIWFSWPNVESTVVWFALLQILSCFDPDGGYRWFCFLILAWCSSWWRKELPLCVNTAYLVRWCCHEWMQLAKFWLCITKKLYTSFINFFRHYVCVFIFVKSSCLHHVTELKRINHTFSESFHFVSLSLYSYGRAVAIRFEVVRFVVRV